MAFHLEKPYINNIGNTKKKPNARQLKAQAEHDAYLRKMGLHPEQLAAKPKAKPKTLNKVVTVDKTGPQVSNGFAPAGAKKSVFDSQWQRTYSHDPEMQAREQLALAEAQAKTKRIAPAYSKGAYQYITSNETLVDIGKKK